MWGKKKRKTYKGDCCRYRWMVIRPKWNCHSSLLFPFKPLHVFSLLKRNCATTQLWLLITHLHLHNASWYMLSWHVTLLPPVKNPEIFLRNFPDQMWHVTVITISRLYSTPSLRFLSNLSALRKRRSRNRAWLHHFVHSPSNKNCFKNCCNP